MTPDEERYAPALGLEVRDVLVHLGNALEQDLMAGVVSEALACIAHTERGRLLLTTEDRKSVV